MSKRPKSRSRHKLAAETSAAELMTIVWMLAAFMTLICEIGAVLTRWFGPAEGSGAEPVGVLAGLLLVGAVVLGVLTLIMTPVVLRSRRTPPPHAITVFAIIVALAPLLTMFAKSLR